MHGYRGWGRGVGADNKFRFMVHVDFQVDRECFSWWCSCGCRCCCWFCGLFLCSLVFLLGLLLLWVLLFLCLSVCFLFFMLLLLLVLYGRWWAKAVKTVGNKTQGREISCQQPCTPTSKKMYELRIWISNREEQRKPPEKGDCTERCIPESGRPTVRHMSHCIFFCDGSNGQYVALARHTFIGQYDTPWHHHTSHHSTWHHHRRTAEGWLTQKTLKNPVWHFHAQIEVTSMTLPRPKAKSSLVPYRTCYQTKTLGMNDQPVWVRHGPFECVPCLESIQFWKFRVLAVLPSFSWVVKTTRDQA